MSFVDNFMAKFKKVDESELNRLHKAKPVEKESSDISVPTNTPLGAGLGKPRNAPSKSITRLRAFTKNKSEDEVRAEDAARMAANEAFTQRSIEDHGDDYNRKIKRTELDD
jgi:hypothetical protein